MKTESTLFVGDKLAILGGSPAFSTPLPVGQLYFPEWDSYEDAFRKLFLRQYYTNQGPLVNQLEKLLAERIRVKHAICVTNATVGLSMVAEALCIEGGIVLPSFTFVATAQAIKWSKLSPIFCDVDPKTHHMNLAHLELLLAAGAKAVMAVNLWGDAYDMLSLEEITKKYRVPLIFDSAHGFGCSVGGKPLGGFGNAEVFSFHATKIMSTCEGGCITTNDDELAERLRNIRSSYGAPIMKQVHRTANGRMSEAQAAVGLLNLSNVDDYVQRNRKLHECYRTGLQFLPGLSVRVPSYVDKTNWQYLVIEINKDEFGLSRDELHATLQKEGVIARRYFYPGAHHCPPFDSVDQPILAETDLLCERVLQLPLGARISEETVGIIVGLIGNAQKNASLVRAAISADMA